MDNTPTSSSGKSPNLPPPTQKKSHLARNVIIFVPIICALILLIPVGVIGTLYISCSVRTNNLDAHTQTIRNKLNNIANSRTGVEAEAHTNGDCLTGSGTTFSIRLNNTYANFNDAEKELNNLIKAQGFAIPTQEMKFFTGSDGTISGGNSEIATISYSRHFTDYNAYDYEFNLQTKIICENASGTALCGNIPRKEVETAQYMSDKPVSSIELIGSIRYEN